MFDSATKSIVWFVSVLTLGVGLSGSVLADPPDPPGVPPPWSPCNIPPVWGKTYATADRFVPVLGGAAYCDKATGLVWDGSPDPNPQPSWQAAIEHCINRKVGDDLQGFHLPLIEQLTSLLPLTDEDLNSATGDGPFSNLQRATYWSATTNAEDPSEAWRMGLRSGNPIANPKTGNSRLAWCVRGGQVYDGQDVLKVFN